MNGGLRADWKAKAGQICDHAIRLTMFSDGDGGWR